jgi:hypothetical protein
MNIRKGPTIHVMKKESANNFGFARTAGILENFTFVNGGTIISINPMANGIFVVPVENELMNLSVPGIK